MKLTLGGFLLRFAFALLLVLLTYNPSGYSYIHWVSDNLREITPYIVLAGVVLIIGWGVYVKATLNSLGNIGIFILGGLFACIVWLFFYWGWLSRDNISALSWVIETLLALLLSIGMCWSHITRRLSGQVDVDELDTH
jgi:hypothetical protein